MDPTIIAIIGLFVGVTGGMFGIGGSIILIPALTEVRGPDQHLYQATAMIMNFLVSMPAVIQHGRVRALDPSTIVRLMPLSIVFVAVGVLASESRVFAGEGEAWLRGLFGVFLFACGVMEIYRATRTSADISCSAEQLGGTGRADFRDAPKVSATRLTWPSILGIAAPTGFISGLLGIGGGILAGPLQRRFLDLPLPIAIANSTALVAATAIFGAIMKNYAFYSEHGSVRQPVLLAAILAPTAIAGSLIGARLTHRVPLTLLRNLFVILLIIASLRLVIGAAGSLNR